MSDPINLRLLNPMFLRYAERDGGVYFDHVNSLEFAQGIRFLCPKCFRTNGGPAGTHGVVCWSESRGTPANARPGPGRWRMDGTGFDDLSLSGDKGRSNSIALTGGCAWHGFVTKGLVTDA